MGKKKSIEPEAFTEEEPNTPELLESIKAELKRLKDENTKLLGGEQLICDAVARAYQEPLNFTIPKPAKQRKKQHEEIAVLHATDTQIGKRTDTYDSVIAESRLLRMADKACSIAKERQDYAILKEIHLVLGGDMVEGENIFPGQAFHLDQGVLEQAVRTSPSIFVRIILRLLEVFETVHVDCVPGNHGRAASRSQGSHPKTNWDRVLYEILQLIIHGSEEHPRKELQQRVRFNIAPSFYAHFNVFDWGVLVVHGDQVTGGFAGYPWYGVGRKTYGWIDAIPEAWDYLLLGHFHQVANALVNHREWLSGGTPESGNEYAQNSLAAAGWPIQRRYFFNKQYGLISDSRLYLDDGDRRPQRLRHSPE